MIDIDDVIAPISVNSFGSGCVAGWPVMQPRGLRSRPAGYAAYASAFGCIAGMLSMCIVPDMG